MSFPKSSLYQHDTIKHQTDMMMNNSVLISPSKQKYQNNSYFLPDADSSSPTKFKQCFYHKRPINFLCISPECKCKYYMLCDDLECKNMHSHPSFNLISVQKFDEFRYRHLRSVNMLKQRVNKYQKEAIELVVHKMAKDFQMIRHNLDTFYVHRAAKKISQGQLQTVTARQLHEFVEKSIIADNIIETHKDANESKSFENSLPGVFLESKTILIESIQNLKKSLTTLTESKQYKNITLQESLVLSGTTNAATSMIKRQTFNSKIIQFQQQYNSIIKMMKQNRIPVFKEFKLLYRGSQHEFCSMKYHQLVDGVPAPIMILILTENGRKFGAVLNCKPQQKDQWISDPSGSSFIYSLDHNQYYKLQSGCNPRSKVMYGGKKGPQIGAGCDIYLSDRCHQNRQSGSNLGGSFLLPFGLEFGSKKAKSHLADRQNFTVVQYEVFNLS